MTLNPAARCSIENCGDPAIISAHILSPGRSLLFRVDHAHQPGFIADAVCIEHAHERLDQVFAIMRGNLAATSGPIQLRLAPLTELS